MLGDAWFEFYDSMVNNQNEYIHTFGTTWRRAHKNTHAVKLVYYSRNINSMSTYFVYIE